MSTRSQVAFAIHKDIVLPEEVKEYFSDADDTVTAPEGTLYVFEDIKWASEPGVYADQDKVMEFLQEQEEGKWRMVEACHAYPDSSSDEGGWVENPFNLQRMVSVHLTWQEPVHGERAAIAE